MYLPIRPPPWSSSCSCAGVPADRTPHVPARWPLGRPVGVLDVVGCCLHCSRRAIRAGENGPTVRRRYVTALRWPGRWASPDPHSLPGRPAGSRISAAVIAHDPDAPCLHVRNSLAGSPELGSITHEAPTRIMPAIHPRLDDAPFNAVASTCAGTNQLSRAPRERARQRRRRASLQPGYRIRRQRWAN